MGGAYLDDFMFTKVGFWQCVQMARRAERDFVRAGLRIKAPKCHMILAHHQRQLGFDLGLTEGKFQVPVDT